MFYYKLNFFYEDFIWHGTKACKKKYFKSPQWLRNIKVKKIFQNGELDIFFQKKNIQIYFLLKMVVGILLI